MQSSVTANSKTAPLSWGMQAFTEYTYICQSIHLSVGPAHEVTVARLLSFLHCMHLDQCWTLMNRSPSTVAWLDGAVSKRLWITLKSWLVRRLGRQYSSLATNLATSQGTETETQIRILLETIKIHRSCLLLSLKEQGIKIMRCCPGGSVGLKLHKADWVQNLLMTLEGGREGQPKSV